MDKITVTDIPVTVEMIEAGANEAISGQRADESSRQTIAAIYRAMRAIEPEIVRGTTKAEFADSIGIGFPINRCDGLIALHLGGTYAYLDPSEAVRLAEKLIVAAREPSGRT